MLRQPSTRPASRAPQHSGMPQDLESRNAHRANLYRLLAECFRYPVIELTDGLGLLEREADALDPGLGLRAKELRENFQQSRDLIGLGIAYSKLFIGPGELIAPPYGSVYMEDNRRTMGNSTLQVAAYYIDAGLSPSRDNKEPPDHISTEMEFMYYLIFQHLKLCQRRFVEKQRNFFLSYVYSWVPQFANDIAQSKIHPFYNSLAVVTTEFFAWEANQFNKAEDC